MTYIFIDLNNGIVMFIIRELLYKYWELFFSNSSYIEYELLNNWVEYLLHDLEHFIENKDIHWSEKFISNIHQNINNNL